LLVLEHARAGAGPVHAPVFLREETTNMKRGALIATVALALAASGCESGKKDSQPSETTTTSGTIHEDRDHGSPAVDIPGGTSTGTITSGAYEYERKDAGPLSSSSSEVSDVDTSASQSTTAKDNKSTTLGNGKSGQYTGGKGTYGGKSTHGTGPGSDIKKKK
jgi:hypothetical protein